MTGPTQEYDFPAELRRFEVKTAIPMLILATLSIGILVYDLTTTSIPESTGRTLEWIDLAISAVFAAEYTWCMKLAGRGMRAEFARTHVIDALAIIPVFQPLRIFRSLRILRTIRIARGAAVFGKGVRAAQMRFHPKVKDIPWMIVLSGAIVALGSAMVYGIERSGGGNITTFPEAMWWGMTTATTVGSTLEPVTPEGRAIGLGLMLLGISLIAAMAGIFAESLLHADEDEDVRLSSIEARLERIEQLLQDPMKRP